MLRLNNVKCNVVASRMVMIIPMLFILMPRPPIISAQYFTYPILGATCIFLILLMSSKIEIDRRVMLASTFFIFDAIGISLSSLFSGSELNLGIFVHILKPLLFLIILIFGYFIAYNSDIGNITVGLLKVAYIILIVQAIVGITQLFDIDLFHLIYSSEKTRPLGESVRIAGTMGNPNVFAWIVIQMAIIVFIFEYNQFKKLIFVLISLILVFFSGSRSLLVLFPLILLFSKFFLDKKNISFFFAKLPKYLFVFVSFGLLLYWIIVTFGEYFPYLNQILMVIDSGSLSSINSFDARTIMWNDAINQMKKENSIFTWVFGLGAGAIEVLDNDYLYSLINYGVIGLLINILMYVYFFYQFSKLKNKTFAVLGQIYIIFSFIIGFQADTLSGWNYPILITFYVGISISLRRKQEIDELKSLTLEK